MFYRKLYFFLFAFLGLYSGSNAQDSIVRPKRLHLGDKVALITPGSFIQDDDLKLAIDNLENLGLEVVLSENLRKRRGYTAGTIQERLDDLHWAFRDSTIDAVWAARGGYGCTSLLPYIDYELIKNNPKIFIGYSDITALHIAIMNQTGLITFHGPVASSEFTDYTVSSLIDVLFKGKINDEIPVSNLNYDLSLDNPLFDAYVINSGRSSGRIVGGNLSLINSLIGTPWELDYKGKVLFLEDISEKPYRIDRMLVQLNQYIPFSNSKSIVLGVFNDCETNDTIGSLCFNQMLLDNFLSVQAPISYGYSIGHIDDQITIPLNINVEIDSDNLTIKYLEEYLSEDEN
jgi:muramoyltetrapeptide carboxypeptidase